jgi:hypothetical protein
VRTLEYVRVICVLLQFCWLQVPLRRWTWWHLKVSVASHAVGHV